MAVTQLSQTPAGTTDFTLLKNEVTKNAKGVNTITLSEYDTDAAPDVKAGSVFENNGATFIVDTSDITPTGYSGISNSTTFYLYYDESAETFIYSATVPVWSDALQGYYNGNDRALFSMYKDSGGTLYEDKNLLLQQNNYQITDNLSIETSLKLSGSPTSGTNVLSSNGATYYFPRGVYSVHIYHNTITVNPNYSYISIETRVNGSWSDGTTNQLISSSSDTNCIPFICSAGGTADGAVRARLFFGNGSPTYDATVAWETF